MVDRLRDILVYLAERHGRQNEKYIDISSRMTG